MKGGEIKEPDLKKKKKTKKKKSAMGERRRAGLSWEQEEMDGGQR